MTLNAKIGALWIFGDFGLRHIFQEWVMPKSLQIDQYNLCMKFSTFNVDLNYVSTAYVQRALKMDIL